MLRRRVGRISAVHEDQRVDDSQPRPRRVVRLGNKVTAVAVIEPTPLELWIATTDPRDLSALDALRLKDPDLSQLEILKMMATQYPKGISASQKRNP